MKKITIDVITLLIIVCAFECWRSQLMVTQYALTTDKLN